jgi:hypothetical protein
MMPDSRIINITHISDFLQHHVRDRASVVIKGVSVTYKGALPWFDVDQPCKRQSAQRLAHRPSGDPELGRQFTLGGKLLAWLIDPA